MPVRVILGLLRGPVRLVLGLRLRHWALAVLATSVLIVLTCSIQWPDHRRFSLTYVGSPPQQPRSFLLSETWVPSRSIPFVSYAPSLPFLLGGGFMSGGGGPMFERASRVLPADPAGTIAGELNCARFLSLGGYRLWGGSLEWDPDPASSRRSVLPRSIGKRSSRVEAGVTVLDYHFLDVATSASTFRVPIDWDGGTRDVHVSVDFNPIAYASFLDLPHHDSWEQGDNRCEGRSTTLVLSPHLARTFRYETFALPDPRPGQPSPRAAATPEVFLVDNTQTALPRNERVTPEESAELKKGALPPGELRLSHDPENQRVTVELTRPPDRDDFVAKSDAVLVLATPSTDGRWFGFDCIRFDPEEQNGFNPIIYTDLEGLKERGARSVRFDIHGPPCTDPDSPRFALAPQVPNVLRYSTTLRNWSSDPVGQPLPKPRGDADAFIVPLSALHGVSERVDDAEWDVLRRKAVLPPGVKLTHRPSEKAISLVLPDPPPADAALVVGTRSSDHRFFGFDCVRLAPGDSAR